MNIRVLFATLLLVPMTGIEAQPARAQDHNAPRMPRQMEQRLQARIDSIVRSRLVLSDEQFTRMRDVATRIERERRTLRREDGQTRMALRTELAATAMNEGRIAELLDAMVQLEKRRVQLTEREQRELARVLTPSQRARYLALQEELRSNMREMQRRRLEQGKPQDGRGGPPSGGRVPPPR